jgi:biotin synthase
LAGANSVFYGDKLLTTGNPDVEADQALFRDAGISAIAPRPEPAHHIPGCAHLDGAP